jgi:hypothetical protein
MSDPNMLDQAMDFARNAGINPDDLIDGVASKVPGGDMMAQVLKTGMNAASNRDDSEGAQTEESAVDDNSEDEA